MSHCKDKQNLINESADPFGLSEEETQFTSSPFYCHSHGDVEIVVMAALKHNWERIAWPATGSGCSNGTGLQSILSFILKRWCV